MVSPGNHHYQVTRFSTAPATALSGPGRGSLRPPSALPPPSAPLGRSQPLGPSLQARGYGYNPGCYQQVETCLNPQKPGIWSTYNYKTHINLGYGAPMTIPRYQDLHSGHNISRCFISMNNGSGKKHPEGEILHLGNFSTLRQPKHVLQLEGVKRCEVWLIQIQPST